MPPKKQRKSVEEIDICTTDKCDRQVYFKLKKGDDVMLRSSDPEKPFVARVEAIETNLDGSVPKILAKWYYRPEETKGKRRSFHGTKEIFVSDDKDWESTGAIEGKRKVHSLHSYTQLDIVRYDDFFSRFHYNFKTGVFTPDSDNFDLVCKCKKPRNPDHYMLQCVQCSQWFHPGCLGTTIDEVKKLDRFYCDECSKQLQDLNNSNSTSKDSDSNTKRKLEVTQTRNNQTKSIRLT